MNRRNMQPHITIYLCFKVWREQEAAAKCKQTGDCPKTKEKEEEDLTPPPIARYEGRVPTVVTD